MQTGFEFRTKGGAKAAGIQGAISNISQAIVNLKNKQNQDNITKAQNTLQMFTKAMEAGDTYTANLLATNPKVVKSWEKYLLMEFPRVEGGDPKSSKLGKVGEPGGISVPGASTNQQIADSLQQALKARMNQMPTDQRAGLSTPEAALSPDQFRNYNESRLGLKLTPAQQGVIDKQEQMALIQANESVTKYALEQNRILAGTQYGADKRLEGVKYAANARRDMVKEIQNAKPDKMAETIYKATSGMYTNLAKNAQTQYEMAMKNKDEKTAAIFKQQMDDFTTRGAALQQNYEGLKILRDLNITTPEDQEQ